MSVRRTALYAASSQNTFFRSFLTIVSPYNVRSLKEPPKLAFLLLMASERIGYERCETRQLSFPLRYLSGLLRKNEVSRHCNKELIRSENRVTPCCEGYENSAKLWAQKKYHLCLSCRFLWLMMLFLCSS